MGYNPVTYPAIAIHTQRLKFRALPATDLRIHDLSSLTCQRPFKRAPLSSDFDGCDALRFLTQKALTHEEGYSQIIFSDFSQFYESIMAEIIRGMAYSKKVGEFARILASEALCNMLYDLMSLKSVCICYDGEIPASIFKVENAVRQWR